MRINNIMGIIFCNSGDDKLSDLTSRRTMGSVPFGCRYRLIDFPLSTMANAGITNVGLVTKRNFQSLADHVGNGRSWDLARKKGGLRILSPYSYVTTAGVYKGRIDALYGNINYLMNSSEEYVLMCDSNIVLNFDIEQMIDAHNESGADITVAYKKGIRGNAYVEVVGGRARKFVEGESLDVNEECCCLDVILLKKELLVSLVQEATLHNYTDFTADVLDRKADELVINGFEVKEHAIVINSMQSYFEANMSLLEMDIRDKLFNMDHPVYTKLRDDMPSRYGFDSNVSDSLIADGCVIEGEVKNSIIFRGVKIEKGAKVENCILMQSAHVGENTQLSYVVADKNVTFNSGRTLMGCRSFPLVIGKGLTV